MLTPAERERIYRTAVEQLKADQPVTDNFFGILPDGTIQLRQPERFTVERAWERYAGQK